MGQNIWNKMACRSFSRRRRYMVPFTAQINWFSADFRLTLKIWRRWLSDSERISMIYVQPFWYKDTNHACDRQTSGRTHGIAVAYTRYSIQYAVARKNRPRNIRIGSLLNHNCRKLLQYCSSVWWVEGNPLTPGSARHGTSNFIVNTLGCSWWRVVTASTSKLRTTVRRHWLQAKTKR